MRISKRRRLGEWPGLRDDQGTSLIELIVGMLVMSIFLAMFTGAILAMNRAENKTEAVSLTTTQLNQAFLTLDKTVRYAAAISPPGAGLTAGDRYVELRTVNTGSEVCSQLRTNLDPNNPGTWQLQMRTWPVPLPTNAAPSAWTPLASNIINNWTATNAVQPFVLKAAVASANAQQLTFNLNALSGPASMLTTSVSTYTLTAANSTVPPPTAPICQDQGRP